MKPLIWAALLLSCSAGVVAQKSDYFTYDREHIGSSMELINEESSNAVALPFHSDTTQAELKKTRCRYFLTGMIPGIIFSTAAGVLPYLFEAADNILIPTTVCAIGVVLPPVIIGFRTRDRDSISHTCLGSFFGAGAVLAVFLVEAMTHL